MMGEVNFVWIFEKVTVFQSTAGLHRLKLLFIIETLFAVLNAQLSW